MKPFPHIMGIVNVTPDSFSDGGETFTPEHAIAHALQLIDEGADILDIGGESSRPGADSVHAEEELRRVIPIIEAIRKHNPTIPISIDTIKYSVAEAALQAGATIINDISGLEYDVRLAKLAEQYSATLILMHMKGTPKSMQDNPTYKNVLNEVMQNLRDKIRLAKSFGVKKIMADMGIGFGKTAEHNWTLLQQHHRFAELQVPMLLGISRKSFLGAALGYNNPKDRDMATALLHALLLNTNVDTIRVHNVKLLSDLKILYQRFHDI